MKLYRITCEIRRLKDIIIDDKHQGIEHSATAYREYMFDQDPKWQENMLIYDFCVEECERLQKIVDKSTLDRSELRRGLSTILCPLAHAAMYYIGMPPQYQNRGDTMSPFCKICTRLAYEGYHCDLCEYDLCTICSGEFS